MFYPTAYPHAHQQHGQQVTNPTAYMRPPPSPTSTSETFAQSQITNRI
jgi:hypothetical protein